jgi:hypothetical protein
MWVLPLLIIRLVYEYNVGYYVGDNFGLIWILLVL